MNAEIITIGDEILIGHTIDTNSAWIARQLNHIGVRIIQTTSISDTPDHIVKALNDARKRADVILLTGGLGPTKDDLTKSTLTDYFSDTLVFDESVYHQLESFFTQRGREMSEHNRQQAMVPSSCKVLRNRYGTAPGMWFEDNGQIVISMPGVPYEMKAIMEDEVVELLKRREDRLEILHKVVITQGVPESELMVMIQEWEQNLPSMLSLAYLPSPGIVKLRISAIIRGKGNTAFGFIEEAVARLESIIPQYIIGYDQDSLEKRVGEVLSKNRLWIATAESCTGGYIGHMLTSVPGSSAYYKGSIVAYHNDVKTDVLGVDAATLQKEGAVSGPVVEKMAMGVIKKLKVDIAIATSGIAGPDGGSEEKPVGTVWIAIAGKDWVVSKKYLFGEERMSNIERSARAGLRWLLKEMTERLVN